MTEKQLADSLDIRISGDYEGLDYVVHLDNSDIFASIFTLLDESNLTIDENKVLINEHVTNITYHNDEFDVLLIGNYDSDVYKLIIRKR